MNENRETIPLPSLEDDTEDRVTYLDQAVGYRWFNRKQAQVWERPGTEKNPKPNEPERLYRTRQGTWVSENWPSINYAEPRLKVSPDHAMQFFARHEMTDALRQFRLVFAHLEG